MRWPAASLASSAIPAPVDPAPLAAAALAAPFATAALAAATEPAAVAAAAQPTTALKQEMKRSVVYLTHRPGYHV